MLNLPVDNSGVPPYVHIREALREAIRDGRLAAGLPIPPENQLAREHHVSRMTVRHAIDGLVAEGLLYRKQGIGTFVTHHRIPHDYSRLMSSYEMVRSSGMVPGTRVLELDIVKAPQAVAAALMLAKGERVVRYERLRLASGSPTAIVLSHVPCRLCPDSVLQEIKEKDSLIEVLESHGVRVRRGVQTIEVRYADAKQAELLGVPEGAPLVYVERVTLAEDGMPVDLAQVYNRADTYKGTMVLWR